MGGKLIKHTNTKQLSKPYKQIQYPVQWVKIYVKYLPLIYIYYKSKLSKKRFLNVSLRVLMLLNAYYAVTG